MITIKMAARKFDEHMKNQKGRIFCVCKEHRQRIWHCQCEHRDNRQWLFIEELPGLGYNEEEILALAKDNPPTETRK
jgi:hypothetical protein